MVGSLFILVLGIYFGQEYQMYIPNIKIASIQIVSFIQEKLNEENEKFKEKQQQKSWSVTNWFN